MVELRVKLDHHLDGLVGWHVAKLGDRLATGRSAMRHDGDGRSRYGVRHRKAALHFSTGLGPPPATGEGRMSIAGSPHGYTLHDGGVNT